MLCCYPECGGKKKIQSTPSTAVIHCIASVISNYMERFTITSGSSGTITLITLQRRTASAIRKGPLRVLLSGKSIECDTEQRRQRLQFNGLTAFLQHVYCNGPGASPSLRTHHSKPGNAYRTELNSIFLSLLPSESSDGLAW